MVSFGGSGEAVPAGSSPMQLAVAALNGKLSDRLRKVLTTYAFVGVAVQVSRGWVNKAKAELTYVVSLPGDDEVYPDVHEWLLERMAPRKRRATTVRSQRPTDDHILYESTPGPDRHHVKPGWQPVKMFYDGSREQTIDIAGHRVRVGVDRPDWAARMNVDMSDRSDRLAQFLRQEERITFTVTGVEARDAVVEFLAGLARKRHQVERKPRFWMSTRWAEWISRDEAPRRTIESVVLRRGQKEALVADLEDFLGREADYARLGVPWHRGYLLHGPPGTGKTSIAKALATHFGLDIYYVPLADLEQDASLLNLVARVPAKSLLLLEDIDTLAAAQDRTDDGPPEQTTFGVTMSGLLNALDGIATPHGLITVMTTNHVEKLDGAIIRKGRADRSEHIDLLDDEQLHDLVHVFLGERIDLPSLQRQLAPADIVEVVKRNLDDQEAAIAALKELITS